MLKWIHDFTQFLQLSEGQKIAIYLPPLDKSHSFEGHQNILLIDGAVSWFLDQKVEEPGATFNLFALGDGDSCRCEEQRHFGLKYHPEKNLTDFELALDLLGKANFDQIEVFGGSGGEFDHYLANLGALMSFLAKKKNFCLTWNENLVLSPGSYHFQYKGLFSIMVLEPTQLTLGGDISFPASKLMLQPLSGRAARNQASGNLQIELNRSAFLILNRDIKESHCS